MTKPNDLLLQGNNQDSTGRTDDPPIQTSNEAEEADDGNKDKDEDEDLEVLGKDHKDKDIHVFVFIFVGFCFCFRSILNNTIVVFARLRRASQIMGLCCCLRSRQASQMGLLLDANEDSNGVVDGAGGAKAKANDDDEVAP